MALRRFTTAFLVFASVLSVFVLAGGASTPARHGRATTTASSAASLRDQVAFEPGAGRLPSGLDYVAQIGRSRFGVGPRGAILAAPGTAVETRLLGARDSAPVPAGRLPGIVNDFTAHDPRAVGMRTYRRIEYHRVYPGIDVAYHARSGAFEYDFALAAGADPGRIQMAIRDGSARPHLSPNGDLLIGKVRQPRPLAWQARSHVAARFVVKGSTVGLQLGRYDRTRPVLIDPRIEFADFVGGSNSDELRDVALDSAGNVLVIGDSRSTVIPGF